MANLDFLVYDDEIFINKFDGKQSFLYVWFFVYVDKHDFQKQSLFLVYLYVHDTMEDVYVCAYKTRVCMIFWDVFDFFR